MSLRCRTRWRIRRTSAAKVSLSWAPAIPVSNGWPAFRRLRRWGIDANKGDRLFINILQQLTRIDAEPIENIIDVDSDEMFSTPFLFGLSVGDWELSPSQAKRMGDYLRRGGFLMVDDFHNDREWANFMAGIRQMELDNDPEELTDDAQLDLLRQLITVSTRPARSVRETFEATLAIAFDQGHFR